MKIITIIGARPQFIKASILSNLIKKEPHIEEIIIHTGQHFDSMMSDIFFNELDIPKPKYNLNISSLSHGAMTGRMMVEIEKILLIENPDLVLVYGDTNSTLSGALTASKLNIPVAHIEAGLRSFYKKMPEEINRKLTDHVSNYLFCPTTTSVENLKQEGITKNVELVGDIMYDSFLYYFKNDEFSAFNLLGLNFKDYCLLTLHRQENTTDFQKVYSLLCTIDKLSKDYDYKFVFPMHPRTNEFLEKNSFKFEDFENIIFISPVSYLDMTDLEINAKIIMTDSGGIQKEAYFAKTPCITLRDQTEWTELVSTGMNVLTGLDSNKISTAFKNFILEYDNNFNQNLYGDGKAGKKILKKIKELIGEKNVN
jgi:UDP-GlcNAc3NAcA epimerase